MGARLINNSRRTNIGHVEDFPVLHMRWLRKSAMFSEGQRTEGHFRCPGASKPITIIVDLRSEHNLEVLLEVGHTDSATNMQVIGLTHRPTGFNGRRWYFVSTNGERAETLFLVGGFFRTRREAGLTYRSQSTGELDRALDRTRKLQVQLEGPALEGQQGDGDASRPRRNWRKFSAYWPLSNRAWCFKTKTAVRRLANCGREPY